ncbi:SNF2 family helicase [Myxococcota bacterium]|nr:SNF2 family helicase [Myxococcota bacterium]
MTPTTGDLPRESTPWWRIFLDAEDLAKRRALMSAVIKGRIKKTPALAAKKAAKIDGDAMELAWSICREENPVDVLRLFDERLEEYAAKNGVELLPRDPALAAFFASGGAEEARRAWEKKVAEEKLLKWLSSEELPPTGERVNVDVVLVAERRLGELPRLAFRVLVSGERAERVPQTPEDLHLLHEDVRAGRKQLGADEKRLVEWIVTRGMAESRESLRSGDTTIPIRATSEWITGFGAAGLVTWADGGACRLDPRPAKIGLLERDGAAPLWAISCPGDLDAPIVSLGEAELLVESSGAGAPEVFARKGDVLRRVETHGMPLELLSLLARTPELPIERLKNAPAGAFLLKRLAHVLDRDAGKMLTKTVAVRPCVELRQLPDNTFNVAAWAKASDGTELVRTHAGPWVPKAQAIAAARALTGSLPTAPARPPTPTFTELSPVEEDRRSKQGVTKELPEEELDAASPNAIAIVPRDEDVEPVDRWLERLVPRNATFVTTDRGAPAFSWKSDAQAVEKALRAWLGRPAGITYLGDTAFRKLVKVQDAPDVKVSIERTSIDWLEVSLDLEEEMAMLSLAEIAEALESSEDEILMVHAQGSETRLYRRDDLERYKKQIEALHAMGLSQKSQRRQLHVLELAESDARTLVQAGAPADRVGMMISASKALAGSNNGIPDAPVAKNAAGFLRSYQRTGVNFLTFAARHLGGALLADDMGLGKTLQTLSSITALRALNVPTRLPSLVICPASVAHNWRREAEKFCPELKVVVSEGDKRKKILQNLGDYDIVIENSALVRRDVDILKEQEFMVIAVDEAQSIKNPGADTTKAVKQLRARHKIALTGTPIENRLTDLWSIVDFICPGYLGTLANFERHAKAEDAEVLHKMLRARLKPLLLRRLKREVAPELPERIEERLDCEMTEGQKMAYLAEVKRTRMILHGAENPEEWNGERRIQILAALTRLRQICCEPELANLPDRGSGKLEELLGLLPDLLEAGHKVLLFSQFVKMLEILEREIQKKGIRYQILTGNTPDRMAVVDAFEKDPTPQVFLISLKAGGTGLNLTSASHVILYDPWWSPALEAQAIDRSHRIGQKKTVVAVRLVTKGTIEERILELQERKKTLVRGVLENASMESTLTPDDFEFLLRDDPDAITS